MRVWWLVVWCACGRVAFEPIECEGGTRNVIARGHCYVLHEQTENVTWDDAQLACELDGGHLATYTSAPEEAAVISSLMPADRTWIGMTDRAAEGTWVWITGEPFGPYMNWRGVEPNNAGGTEHCGAHSAPATSWQWNDLDCDGGTNTTLAFMCEYDH